MNGLTTKSFIKKYVYEYVPLPEIDNNVFRE